MRGYEVHRRVWPGGFTLIELLVVISVVAVLMAILVPVIHRVRRQGKAVVCQSNLRQWGVLFMAHANENDGRLDFENTTWHRLSDDTSWLALSAGFREYQQASDGILTCPMATKLVWEDAYGEYNMGGPPVTWIYGGTHRAWALGAPVDSAPCTAEIKGSYGINRWVGRPETFWEASELPHHRRKYYWSTTDVKNAADVPVLLECIAWHGGYAKDTDAPVEYDDDVLRGWAVGLINSYNMNRHDGGINGLFMDWSVRKVGLKELWTLKWNPQFDTAGAWTKAGGVRAEDWPEWMRGFRHY